MNIRYIKNQIQGSTANGYNHWVEIQAIDGVGTNVALNKSVTASFSTTSDLSIITNGDTSSTDFIGGGGTNVIEYIQVDLGSVQAVKDVKVYHFHSDARTYLNNITYVSTDGVNWVKIFDSNIEGNYVETADGKTTTLSAPYVETTSEIDNTLGFGVNVNGFTVSKTEVLINDVIKQEYTSGYDNISFDVIYDGDYRIGNNKVVLRITYDDNLNTGAVSEKWMIHVCNVTPLDGATLQETVNRIGILTNTVKMDKKDLGSALVVKGVEVLETDKMSTLIDKVGGIEIEKHNLPTWFTLNDTYVVGKQISAYKKGFSTSSVVGNNIYVIGGYTGSVKDYVFCYDVVSNSVSTKTSTGYARCNLVSASIGTDIYCIGGGITNMASGATGVNQCYDTINNTWSSKASMPNSRFGASIGKLDNNIYVMGGYATSYLNINQCYDAITNTWNTKTNMIKASRNACYSTVNKKIYVISGRDTTVTSINQCYDIETDTWTTKTIIPLAREYITASSVGDLIYCFGGSVEKTNQCYNTITDTWSTKADMFRERYGSCASTIDNLIYVMEGEDGTDYTNTTEIYIP